MVLDPMSALSVAASVVQFVDFSSKLVSKGCRIYHSTDGALSENLELESTTRDLWLLTGRLKQNSTLDSLNEYEQSLDKISSQCVAIGDELLDRLQKLKLHQNGKHRRWKSFRQALKVVWSKKELDDLSARLSVFRKQLEFHILLSLKESNDLIGLEQSTRFDRLDDNTQALLRTLLQDRAVFSSELSDQRTSIAQLHAKTRNHISTEATRTRTEIINAIENSNRGSKPEVFAQSQPLELSTLPYTDDDVLIEDAILEALSFSTMHDRYDAIEDAHGETFNWLFENSDVDASAWDNFPDWLSNGRGLYWISGKAGSGKSTLMRYIHSDSRTKDLLVDWADSSEDLVMVAFFFWISGAEEQSSQIGLLRGLMFDLLRLRRHLIKPVFYDDLWPENLWPEKHIPRKSTNLAVKYIQNYRWNLPKIKKYFKRLFGLNLGPIFMLIDGLDEYAGDPEDTVKLLKSIASPTVKICVSSRPWQEFEVAFHQTPKLRLQDLTSHDIEHFVKDELLEDHRIKELFSLEPVEAPKLVQEIVAKAEGVFLWVRLVVRSFLHGLTNGDRIYYFRKRLDEIPTEIEALYSYMLKRIDSRYFEEASRLFSILNVASSSNTPLAGERKGRGICAISLSFAMEEDEELAFSAPIKLLSKSEVESRVLWIDRRLKVCCAGLLELSSNRPNPTWGAVEWHNRGNRDVVYLHRTARDFLHENVDQQIPSMKYQSPKKFLTMMMRSNILFCKGCMLSPIPDDETNGEIEPERVNQVVCNTLSLARKIEGETGNSEVKLLDEFHRVLSSILPSSIAWAKFSEGSTFNVRDTPVAAADSHDDFLALTIVWGLALYVATKLGEDIDLLKKKKGKPYLDYALRLPLDEDLMRGWNLDTIQLLLEHGSNPNKMYHGLTSRSWWLKTSSPWQAVLEIAKDDEIQGGNTLQRPLFQEHDNKSSYPRLFELLLRNRADRNAFIIFAGNEYTAADVIYSTLRHYSVETGQFHALLHRPKRKRISGVWRKLLGS